MPQNLLQTRLVIPPLRAGAVSRPRLIDLLNAGLSGRLTLMSAPAGFGKTTLVLEWLRQLPAPGFPWSINDCAWVSLDPGDNQPAQFFSYLLAALQRVAPGFGADLDASLANAADTDLTVLVQDLLNEFGAGGRPYLLVLDDFHLIHDGTLHELINLAVEYLPPNVHIVLTSRDSPPLDLPRWRVRGYLNEVTAPALRFNAQEVRDFLAGTMQLDLHEDVAAMLKDRTEGWAAGLQLAALALRSKPDQEGWEHTLADFWDLSGRDRAVADYLLSEVLDRQLPEIQEFLFRTAIIPQFNASLCDALLAVPPAISAGSLPAQRMLDQLEKSDLFLVPLDNERGWYRYHHLFRELLLSRVQDLWPIEQVNKLHRVASDWFATAGLVSDAVDQAFLAGEETMAARLVEQVPMHQLWHSDLGAKIPAWRARMSDEVLLAFPGVTLQTAGTQLIRGEISGLRRSLEWLKVHEQFEPERQVLEAILVRNNGQLLEAFEMLEGAIQRLPDSFGAIRDVAYLQLSVCSLEMGDYKQAEHYAEYIRGRYETTPVASGEIFPVHLQVFQILGTLAELGCDLVQAQAVYQAGLDLIADSGKSNPMTGLFFARLGSIHYQWNEIQVAEDYFSRAMSWGERTRISDILFSALFGQAELACYYRNVELLEDIFAQFQRLVQGGIPGMEARSAGAMAAYRLRIGQLERAVRWANASGLPLEIPPPYILQEAYQTLAAVRIAESHELKTGDQLPAILAVVDKLIPQAEQVGNRMLLARNYLLRALLLNGLNDKQEAVRALYRSLEIGEAGGLVRLYLDAGPPLHDLLQKALAFGEQITPIRRLLVAFAQEPGATEKRGHPTPRAIEPGSTGLAEPLTERENEVLFLIARGLSNKSIQDQLFISNNTVRTHIKNLYGKLGVNDRTHAVLRAQELGLV